MDEFQAPTGVVSSISSLPGLDEMLGGGLIGNWLIAGVTSIGKTTLATAILANSDGTDSAAILDYGTRQGHERYFRKLGKTIEDFDDFIKEDQELLRETAIALNRKKDIAKGSPSLQLLFPLFGTQEEGHQIREAALVKKLQGDIVKVDLRLDERREESFYHYFGSTNSLEDLTDNDKLMSVFLYLTYHTNDARRFLIDGISLAGDIRPLQQDVEEHSFRYGSTTGHERNVRTVAAPKSLLYTEDVLPLYKYFNGEIRLPLPFTGINLDEFQANSHRFGSEARVYWRLDQQPVTLTSLTLTGDSERENVADIDDAINHVEQLKIAQELDGIIILGRNIKSKYAFSGNSNPAPPRTRMIAIIKSRYGADETYREISLSQRGLPVLGREMVYLNH